MRCLIVLMLVGVIGCNVEETSAPDEDESADVVETAAPSNGWNPNKGPMGCYPKLDKFGIPAFCNPQPSWHEELWNDLEQKEVVHSTPAPFQKDISNGSLQVRSVSH